MTAIGAAWRRDSHSQPILRAPFRLSLNFNLSVAVELDVATPPPTVIGVSGGADQVQAGLPMLWGSKRTFDFDLFVPIAVHAGDSNNVTSLEVAA
jgi:hypothetical protein